MEQWKIVALTVPRQRNAVVSMAHKLCDDGFGHLNLLKLVYESVS